MRETDPLSGSKDPGHRSTLKGGTQGSRSLGRPPGGGDSSLNSMGEWQFWGDKSLPSRLRLLGVQMFRGMEGQVEPGELVLGVAGI